MAFCCGRAVGYFAVGSPVFVLGMRRIIMEVIMVKEVGQEVYVEVWRGGDGEEDVLPWLRLKLPCAVADIYFIVRVIRVSE